MFKQSELKHKTTSIKVFNQCELKHIERTDKENKVRRGYVNFKMFKQSELKLNEADGQRKRRNK